MQSKLNLSVLIFIVSWVGAALGGQFPSKDDQQSLSPEAEPAGKVRLVVGADGSATSLSQHGRVTRAEVRAETDVPVHPSASSTARTESIASAPAVFEHVRAASADPVQATPGKPELVDPHSTMFAHPSVVGLLIGSLVVLIIGAVVLKLKMYSKDAEDGRLPEPPDTGSAPDYVAFGGWKCFLACFTLGVLNNNAYNMVMGASQKLAAHYHKEDMVATLPTLMLAACFSVTLMNGAYFLQIPFRKRIGTLVVVLAGAYGILAVAASMTGPGGFLTALLACIVVGACTSLGELCCLSFFRELPAEALGGWGAGTGFAGIIGSAAYLGLLSVGFALPSVFAFMMPTALIYWLAFDYLDHQVQEARSLSVARGERPWPVSNEPGDPMTFENLQAVWKCASYILVCMVAVYFLEYFIYPGLVDRDSLCPQTSSFLGQHVFTVSWLAYNVGVTVSRASVALFRVERLWILAVLQFVNAALWIYEAATHKIVITFGSLGYTIIVLWMVWVGVMGGCTYANCMYGFAKRPDIPDNLRELGITIGFAMSNIGIMLATASSGILDNTVLSMSHVWPNGC